MSHEKLAEFFGPMEEQHHMAMGTKEHICKFDLMSLRLRNSSKIPVDLEVIATHESARKRGYGTMLLELGNKMADDMDYALYLDAEKDAKDLYLKVGYKEIADVAQKSPLSPLLRKKKSERA